MRLGIGIQGRTASTRFPGKIYEDIDGVPMLERIYRTCETGHENPVYVLGPEEDQELHQFCNRHGLQLFLGHPTDLLERYVSFAATMKLAGVIRVTGDCPLLASQVVLQVISSLERGLDYVSNTIYRTFPEGQDVQGCSVKALKWFYRQQKEEREHPFKLFDENQIIRNQFGKEGMRYSHILNKDNPILIKTSIDTREELERLRKFFERKSA